VTAWERAEAALGPEAVQQLREVGLHVVNTREVGQADADRRRMAEAISAAFVRACPHLTYADPEQAVGELADECTRLRSLCREAAKEFDERWEALCDQDGGPTNLRLRLHGLLGGGYTSPGVREALRQVMAQRDQLKERQNTTLDALEDCADALEGYACVDECPDYETEEPIDGCDCRWCSGQRALAKAAPLVPDEGDAPVLLEMRARMQALGATARGEHEEADRLLAEADRHRAKRHIDGEGEGEPQCQAHMSDPAPAPADEDAGWGAGEEG